ncbi:hypothetical protein M3Y94_01315000 [Aphelenchoides besseyi]|nr:hypothetical protein M3Y94_01315000 [Aphelenchoides besseyi]KAI6220302.1 hypothetical protein M3Y95_01070800 [Aphelenchoides besseyi]
MLDCCITFVQISLCILFPPLAIGLFSQSCNRHVFLSIFLCLLGWFPAVLHAFYFVFWRSDKVQDAEYVVALTKVHRLEDLTVQTEIVMPPEIQATPQQSETHVKMRTPHNQNRSPEVLTSTPLRNNLLILNRFSTSLLDNCSPVNNKPNRFTFFPPPSHWAASCDQSVESSRTDGLYE